MNLLVALSACPQGDVSISVGKEVPDEKCHPLKVEVFRGKWNETVINVIMVDNMYII